MVAKAGLGLIGLSAIGIGGVAVTKPYLLGMDYMPEFHALSKDHDFSTNNNYTDSHFGKKYKNYLVGVTNKTSEDDSTSNKAWWEWSFRRLQAHKSSSEKFKHEGKKASDAVTMAYAKDNAEGYAKALNQVCKKTYKEDDSTNETEIWKYCSPLGKKPTTVGAGEYTDQIGSTSGENFISVKDGANDMFWSIREKEVQGKDSNFEKVPSEAITSEHFKKRNLTMKELCKQAYETKTNPSSGDTTNPTKADTQKYCKFKIS